MLLFSSDTKFLVSVNATLGLRKELMLVNEFKFSGELAMV